MGNGARRTSAQEASLLGLFAGADSSDSNHKHVVCISVQKYMKDAVSQTRETTYANKR